MKKYILLFSFLFFYFCNDKSKNSIVETKNNILSYKKLKLTEVGVKKFSLDYETAPYIDCFQYIQSAHQLVFLNAYNNSLYFYDYLTGEFIKKKSYEKEGSNGVGKLQGFLYHAGDSVYTYSYNTFTLCALDSLSQVYKKKMMYNQSTELNNNFSIVPTPCVITTAPIKKIGKFVVMAGFVGTETYMETPSNRPTVCLYDTENDTIQYVVNYPKQYSENNWGGGFTYRFVYYTVKDDNIIVSFPASHHLIKYNLYSKFEKIVYAGSGKVKYIKPYSYNKKTSIDERKAWDWYMNTPSYESILYDKFRNCYYRIARLPDSNYKKGQRKNNKPIVIIKLNKNLEYVGEVQVPMDRKWFSQKVFITEKGLNMAFEFENEDFITFQIFNIDE